MRRLWRQLRDPYSGAATYKVFGRELSIDVGFDNIPLPRLHHERGWYIAFSFGTRYSDPINLIEYDYGASQ